MKNIINKVYIVPDYQATSNDHWYPWLSRQLKNVGVDSKRIMLANPFQPDLEEWQQNLKLHIPHLDEHTFLVAHGLSGLSVLSFFTATLSPAAPQDRRGHSGFSFRYTAGGLVGTE